MTSINDFNYQLTQELIAQKPAEPRDSSRLLLLNRKSGDIEHKVFKDIIDELQPGDLLVMNNSKVFKARLKATCYGREHEVFLLRPKNTVWQSLIKKSRHLKIGDVLDFGSVKATLINKEADGIVEIDFHEAPDKIFQLAEAQGEVPLPPYIKATVDNTFKYQTVYAEHTGSVAAPTAGFHFTPELLESIRNKGVEITFVTLHVGLGTFRPIMTETLEEHQMHSEFYDIPQETVKKIRQAKRVISVGTTTTRALESAFQETHPLVRGDKGGPISGETNLFISPGYQFKVVDAMITNFHLPKSSLLVMVSAFAGREHVLHAYEEAVQKNYRFYSFGDAMFIQ
ncbi:MAG: tRNA preQ1(34) S-adenosylmethionine ribosyltransferase-isomerase QueA [Patescibacteria group bacterium]|nr:tRNA preQ1(34) S-adenosylmethionine ribosyltransferase-isomerase QueA [Patescibacteria group bacterium]